MARICIVRQGYFSLDPRVRSEVAALLSAGHEVDLICLRWPGEPRYERDGRFRVRRLSIRHYRGRWSTYLFEYSAFLIIAGVMAGLGQLRRHYDLIQVNTIPDSLVFSALVPRLLGARVLLDLHECMPEFFATKFKLGPGHPFVRLVARVEQAAIRFADFATTCTEPMRRAFISRGAPPDKIAVILGTSGLTLGSAIVQAPAPRSDGRFVLICHGTIEERYGLDTVVRAMALLKDEIPDLDLAIYGDGSYRPVIQALVRELHLEDRVSLSDGWVPMAALLRAIKSADAGVVAMKRDAFRELTLCNKMFDFIGLRRPAIVSRTQSVEEYFDDGCFEMFTAGDEHDLARAIRNIYWDAALRARLVDRAARVAQAYRWSQQREKYLQIVDALVQRRRPNEIPEAVRTSAEVGVAQQS
jgi:glycosyltransferase involved in cell wall biosynthesis